MSTQTDTVLILGSAPSVLRCRDWPRAPFDSILAINNAWRVRPDWDHLAVPEDFAADRMPPEVSDAQQVVDAAQFVPAQNRYGGFVLAGGTMAYTAAYWALDALRPKVLGFLGCDMVYPGAGATHFYGTGTADPLRADISLRDLGAKSARLALIAAAQGCACVNLSEARSSALLFPRATVAEIARGVEVPAFDMQGYRGLRATENALGYDTPDGRYWDMATRFDTDKLDGIDQAWRALYATA